MTSIQVDTATQEEYDSALREGRYLAGWLDGMPFILLDKKRQQMMTDRKEHARYLIRAGIFPAYPELVASLGLRPDEHPPLSWYHPPKGLLTSNNCWPPEEDEARAKEQAEAKTP